MKKQIALVLGLALMAALIPGAHAEAPAVAAVYAVPETQPETDGAKGEEPAVVYLYEDGTYERYVLRDGQLAFSGEMGLAGAAELAERGWLRVYPLDGEPVLPTPAAVYEPIDGGAETFDEGVDTKIEIVSYAQYNSAFASGFLSEGDQVAVISPSSLPTREQAAMTAEGLRRWGFVPVLGQYVCPETRTLSECIADLTWALQDPEIKAIFCVRGGYGATEILDALPEELIAAANKPIIGYSDITAYNAAWTAQGVPSVHACMSAAFTDLPAACADTEQRMLKGEVPVYLCPSDEFCRVGEAEGILIGGNLSTLAATLNTAYDCTKMDEPYILFLEEVGENMQHIHRYLTILRNAGVLDRAAGIIFGEWTELPSDGLGNYGEARGGLFASVADMITRQFMDGIDVPVAFGFPMGHGEVCYPLLMGVKTRLYVSEDCYTISWPSEPVPTEQPLEATESPLPEAQKDSQ